MAVKKEKKMDDKLCLCFSVRVMWTVVGFVLVGGIYLLSYNNVDETVVSQTTNFVNYMRTVLK